MYDEHPNVKVTIIEVACEYNYSNPTGHFNLSLPHIEAKTTMYQTMSYQTFKRIQLENERARQLKDKFDLENKDKNDNSSISTKASVQASVNLNSGVVGGVGVGAHGSKVSGDP